MSAIVTARWARQSQQEEQQFRVDNDLQLITERKRATFCYIVKIVSTPFGGLAPLWLPL